MKLIDIKKLTFEYFKRDEEGNLEEMIEALKDVDLSVEQGQFIAIVGKNGSGKSTLAKHMNALLLPGEGEVIVDGMDTTDSELRLEIRKTAGMVFQNPDNQIIANVVEEEVAFGPENLGVPTSDIWNRVDSSLEYTNMQQYRTSSPNHLSGGQKQRVAIASVLAMEPKCIIFDEATAMLDPAGRKQILEVAKYLQQEKNITIILITHHMDEVLYADQVFVMDAGKIALQGTPETIFEHKDEIERCGMEIPMLYEYVQFLEGQDIIGENDAIKLKTEQDLLAHLQHLYGIGRESAQIAETAFVREQFQESQMQGLVLHNLSYVYNQGLFDEKIALQDVNFAVGQGEFVAIIGQTGSGKSTLMQHLNGIYTPTSGTVFFHGVDIEDKDFSKKELRQKVGLVFQYPEHQLFAETVEEDVCFGPMNMGIAKVEAQKRAYEAIAAVGLPDTIYDMSPLQLSGGQKRRVAIAGVLAMQPEYLVLDEPTAGLDPVAARELLQLLKQLQKTQNTTIILVTHSMEYAAEYAERVLVLHEGRIVMDDETARVFSRQEQLEQIGLQVPLGIRMLNMLRGINGIENKHAKRIDVCGELLKLKG